MGLARSQPRLLLRRSASTRVEHRRATPRAESLAQRGITSVIRVSSRSGPRSMTAGSPASGVRAFARPTRGETQTQTCSLRSRARRFFVSARRRLATSNAARSMPFARDHFDFAAETLPGVFYHIWTNSVRIYLQSVDTNLGGALRRRRRARIRPPWLFSTRTPPRGV